MTSSHSIEMMMMMVVILSSKLTHSFLRPIPNSTISRYNNASQFYLLADDVTPLRAPSFGAFHSSPLTNGAL